MNQEETGTLLTWEHLEKAMAYLSAPEAPPPPRTLILSEIVVSSLFIQAYHWEAFTNLPWYKRIWKGFRKQYS